MKYVGEFAKQAAEGSVFQAADIARAMVLRWECGWHILLTPRRPVWLVGKKEVSSRT